MQTSLGKALPPDLAAAVARAGKFYEEAHADENAH
jgi:hypothetical protein